MIPKVKGVEALARPKLKITFADGVVTEADLSKDLGGEMTAALQDPAFFTQVRVDADSGAVAWPNGYDLDPVVLHGDLPAAAPSRLKVRRIATRSIKR